MSAPLAHAATVESPVPAKVMAYDSVTMQAAPHAQYRAAHTRTYTLRRGDYLSRVSVLFCGTAADWPGIWHATRGISNPNMVPVGLTVDISCTSAGGWYSAPAPLVAQTASYSSSSAPGGGGGGSYGHPYYCGDGDGDGFDVTCASIGRGGDAGNPGYQSRTQRVYSGARAARSYSGGTYHGSGGMQGCIIRAESGGNSQIMNGTGHYGLYQFAYGTWVANGGSPGSFGHASVAEQNQVYYNTVARSGYSAWTPYDGC
jgi:Transglycosylase-like domain